MLNLHIHTFKISISCLLEMSSIATPNVLFSYLILEQKLGGNSDIIANYHFGTTRIGPVLISLQRGI